MWVCNVCTFANESVISTCEMCGSAAEPSSSHNFDALLAAQLEEQEAKKLAESQPAQKKLKPEQQQQSWIESLDMSVVKEFEQLPSSAPTSEAIARITSDLKDVMRNGGEAFFFFFFVPDRLPEAANNSMFRVLPERKDITRVHAVLFGPSDTPYEFGCFHFSLRFASNHPWVKGLLLSRPPRHVSLFFSMVSSKRLRR